MDKDGPCPCLDPKALPRQINVDGHNIGIVGLTEIIDAVHKLGLADEAVIKKELLERVRKRNWAPWEAQDKYADALFLEYSKSAQNKESRQT